MLKVRNIIIENRHLRKRNNKTKAFSVFLCKFIPQAEELPHDLKII